MHGPSIKKLAIPLAADNKEDIKVAMYKKSTSFGSNDIVPVCLFPWINFGWIPQMVRNM